MDFVDVWWMFVWISPNDWSTSQRANQQLGIYFEWLPDMTRKQLDVLEAHSPTARPPVRGLKREIGSAG